jgi:uncharacterized lipoprotein YmbA
MKFLVIGLAFILSGCASISNEQLYYEASKSISKDQTMSQTACWSAISEIAKSNDTTVRISAIALAEKCKVEPVKLQAPKKSWLPF